MNSPIKKLLLSTIILTFSLPSFANNCAYYMHNDSLLYAGYTINYSKAVTTLMSNKNYARVFDPSEAQYELEIDAYEITGRFNKAHSQLKLIENNETKIIATQEKTCFTQFCAVSDIAKSLSKLIRKQKRKLSKCEL